MKEELPGLKCILKFLRFVRVGMFQVPVSAYHAIPKYCKQIKILRIISRAVFDDLFVNLLIQAYSETLEELRLHSEHSDETIRKFTTCKKLKRLMIRSPTMVTIKEILTTFPSLNLTLTSFPHQDEEQALLNREFLFM
ncbi:hypothetical protein M1146_06635 [Patescibacteria group bacterium]|nr:hypothetical protein [Patescibacteria group bacterium]